MTSPKMGLMNTWNDICLSLNSGLLFCILVKIFVMCCHEPYHPHHSLQLICHQQFKTHLVDLWKFYLFFHETCHLPDPLQMAVICICFFLNWHVNVVKCDDCSSRSPELACMKGKYLPCLILGICHWRQDL